MYECNSENNSPYIYNHCESDRVYDGGVTVVSTITGQSFDIQPGHQYDPVALCLESNGNPPVYVANCPNDCSSSDDDCSSSDDECSSSDDECSSSDDDCSSSDDECSSSGDECSSSSDDCSKSDRCENKCEQNGTQIKITIYESDSGSDCENTVLMHVPQDSCPPLGAVPLCKSTPVDGCGPCNKNPCNVGPCVMEPYKKKCVEIPSFVDLYLFEPRNKSMVLYNTVIVFGYNEGCPKISIDGVNYGTSLVCKEKPYDHPKIHYKVKINSNGENMKAGWHTYRIDNGENYLEFELYQETNGPKYVEKSEPLKKVEPLQKRRKTPIRVAKEVRQKKKTPIRVAKEVPVVENKETKPKELDDLNKYDIKSFRFGKQMYHKNDRQLPTETYVEYIARYYKKH
jgi:hypothetical protein